MASLLAEGESKGAPSEGSVVSNDDETLTSQNLPHELEQMANAKWSLESAANLVEAIDNTLDDTAEDFTEEENAFAPAAKSMKYIEKKIMRRCITSRYCNFKHLDSLLGPFFKSHGTERANAFWTTFSKKDSNPDGQVPVSNHLVADGQKKFSTHTLQVVEKDCLM